MPEGRSDKPGGESESELELEPVTEPEVLPTTAPGLAKYDPLAAYLQEVRRYPLLGREEEQRLARLYRETGDREAARRLVTSNLLLVVKIAREYRKAYSSLLDLVQEGNIGLMQAVQKFDPDRGTRLTTYAAWWIRAYILKFIMANWRLVKIGTSQAERRLFYNLKRTREKLQRLGFDAGPRLLAEHLNVSEHDVIQMQQRMEAPEASLDAPISRDEGDERRRGDTVATLGPGPDVMAEQEQFQRLLREKLEAFGAQLKGRDRTIFDERLLAEEPKTLAELGGRFGITRERARQIEARLLKRLRDYLKAELGESVDIAAGEDH